MSNGTRNVLGLSEAIALLPRRPALLIGPDATTPPGAIAQARKIALAAIGVVDETYSSATSLATFLDSLRTTDVSRADRLELELRYALARVPASVDLNHLAKVSWSACISIAEDMLFERAVRDYFDAVPSSRTVTIVDHPRTQPPQRTLPIYKLLGNLDNSDPEHRLALAASDLMLREQDWPAILRSLADHMRDAPIFCIGTESTRALLQKVLGTLVSLPKPTASAVMFLSGDPILRDPTVSVLLRKLTCREIDASLKEFCSAVADLKPIQQRLSLGYSAQDPRIRLQDILDKYAAVISAVPTDLPPNFEPAKHMNSLVDGLFRPTSIDWAPYLCKFDLQRSIALEIKAAINQLLVRSRPGALENVTVLGEAGVGKTTLLKRVAVDLASEGKVVLWCRRSLSGSWARQFRQMSNELSALLRRNENRHLELVLVCDDPWALRLDASELMGCFDKFQGKVVFIFALRNSDYFTSDGPSPSSPPPPAYEVEVPYELSNEELQGLARMLVVIGAFPDLRSAAAAVAAIPSPHAKDILCSLWYLVPETKSQLASSLEDQYRRLDVAGQSISSFAQHAASASHVARRAYELVTVTSNLDIDLPIEVIVRALKVDYAEWLDVARDGRPLWGLLYDDKNEDETTIVYRTRNEVVTQVLLDLVNGGVGHAGEFQILKELISACDGGSAVYRNFVLDVLLRSKQKLARTLTYEQGLELFVLAQATLPYQDRVLEHHKGVWMAQVGRDFKAAYSQFERALETETYPGADRDAPVEHIHTSMAAAVVQLVRAHEQARETGMEVVRTHLRYASTPTFFNPHTSHVAANLLFEMAKQNGVLQQDAVGLGAIAEALQEIEKAMQLIGARGRGHFRFQKSLHILDELKREIIGSLPDIEVMKDVAADVFARTKSQTGFEAVARALLAQATHVDKGRAFNALQTYIKECEQSVRQQGQALSIEMRSVRADLLIRWRVQRPSGPIDWNQLRDDLDAVTATGRYRDDVVKRFYLGVALFHLADVTNARAKFSELRRAVLSPTLRPNDIRCLLLGKEGRPRRVQCTLERGHAGFYANIPELGTDVPVQSPPSDAGPGATTHCYVGFSFHGPTAVFNRPDDEELMLA